MLLTVKLSSVLFLKYHCHKLDVTQGRVLQYMLCRISIWTPDTKDKQLMCCCLGQTFFFVYYPSSVYCIFSLAILELSDTFLFLSLVTCETSAQSLSNTSPFSSAASPSHVKHISIYMLYRMSVCVRAAVYSPSY